MAMLWKEASKSLCPSNKLAMPALPLHGRSFKKGVKFSVHTTSCGNTPCRSRVLARVSLEWCPSGRNDNTGRIVFVSSMKFRLAQNSPDRALVRVNHLPSASSSFVASSHAQSSTPCPPSFLPSHGRAPHVSVSQRPNVNLRCSSRVPANCRICASDRGNSLKFCASKSSTDVFERKSKLASNPDKGNGRRFSCS